MKRLLFTLSLMLLASGVFAQHWQRLTQPVSVPSIYGALKVPYFIDTLNGFVFDRWAYLAADSPNLTNGTNLQRTTDGGKSWRQITFFDDSGLAVSQMCFVSKTKGYASTFNPGYIADTGGVFETTDLGDHWRRITPPYAFVAIYAVRDKVFAIRDSGQLYVITHDTTLDSVTTIDGAAIPASYSFCPLTFGYYPTIVGNKDSLVIVGLYDSSYGNKRLLYSTDLGTAWHFTSDSLSGYYGYTFYCIPHTCNIIQDSADDTDLKGVKGLDGDSYSFYQASLPFSTRTPSLLHRETGGYVAGNPCALYISDACDAGYFLANDLNDSTAILRSTDRGESWQNLPKIAGLTPGFNELDDLDYQNLSVVGHGAVVYADSFGEQRQTIYYTASLWKTTDGGDGTLSAAALAPVMALAHLPFPSETDTLDIPSCEASQMVVTNSNIGCSYATFDSATIVGLDTSEYSVTSTHYCGCTHVPDSSFITLAPEQTGIRNVTVHFHYTDDEYNQIDTSIQFILNVQSGGTSVPITLAFQSSSMNASPGDTISIPIYLSGSATLGGTAISLPFTIDTNILLPVGFQPAIPGMIVDTSYYSNGTENVSLTSANNLALNGSTLIGYLRCLVYLTDTLTTAIALPTATLNSATVPCVALSLTTDSIGINIVGCGTKTLQQFMLTGEVPSVIQRIVPNPAGNEITIVVAGSGDYNTFVISDPLGRSYTVPTTPQPPPWKGGGVVLDISSLPAGVYFVSDGVSGARFVKE